MDDKTDGLDKLFDEIKRDLADDDFTRFVFDEINRALRDPSYKLPPWEQTYFGLKRAIINEYEADKSGVVQSEKMLASIIAFAKKETMIQVKDDCVIVADRTYPEKNEQRHLTARLIEAIDREAKRNRRIERLPERDGARWFRVRDTSA